MKQGTCCALTLVLATTPLAGQTPLPQWLVGCWSDRAFHEVWSPSGSDQLLGIGSFVRDSARRVSERLIILNVNGQLVYRARPMGAASATDFVATHVSNDSLVFEDPSHDFPRKLVYAQQGPDLILVTLTGVENGTPRTQQFRLVRRPDCSPASEVALGHIDPGAVIRVHTAAQRVTGEFASIDALGVNLRNEEGVRRFRYGEIERIDRRTRSTGRGALIGGVIGAVGLTSFIHIMISGLCDSTEGCGSDHRRAWGYGIVLGGAGGALLGAGIGALVNRWQQVP